MNAEANVLESLPSSQEKSVASIPSYLSKTDIVDFSLVFDLPLVQSPTHFQGFAKGATSFTKKLSQACGVWPQTTPAS